MPTIANLVAVGMDYQKAIQICDDSGGWVRTADPWTRFDSSNFVVPASLGRGVGSALSTGVKIRWIDSGSASYKYAYIAGYPLPSGKTKIQAGSDYSISSNPTEAWYSRADIPQGFPDWFNFTANYGTGGGAGPMTFTSPTTSSFRFRVSGRQCFMRIYFRGTTGGTADYFIDVGLPFAVPNTNNDQWGYCYIEDGGYYQGYWRIAQNGTPLTGSSVEIHRNDNAVWTLGANRYSITNNCIYEIADIATP